MIIIYLKPYSTITPPNVFNLNSEKSLILRRRWNVEKKAYSQQAKLCERSLRDLEGWKKRFTRLNIKETVKRMIDGESLKDSKEVWEILFLLWVKI